MIGLQVQGASSSASRSDRFPAQGRPWEDRSPMNRCRNVLSTRGAQVRKPVELRYEDLLNDRVDLRAKIEEAFGYDGLGLLTVSGVPGLKERRQALLPLARSFALLPENVKALYEHKESFYSFGWSHGKEKLQGRPDLAKGSYYANPLYDRPCEDEELMQRHVAFLHPNIWPTAHLPSMEEAFKDLGRLIVQVGLLVSKQCDALVHSRCPAYPPNRLHETLTHSRCCKARLLHYFPLQEGADNDRDDQQAREGDNRQAKDDVASWCGWHNDHGSLTGLASAMYLDSDGKEVHDSDPTAGLYVLSRSGELVRVAMPSDQLAFQIGETAQIHSGGLLQATPHAVRGSSSAGVTRETFAVFMEPDFDEPMSIPQGRTPEDAQTQRAAERLPKGVTPLASRWQVGMDFGTFTDRTLNAFH